MIDVDRLSNEIRRVDGSHSLGAGALAEALLPFIEQSSAVEIARLREELEWYGEQARLARLIHSEGDKGRWALADDGGKRARAALASEPTE